MKEATVFNFVLQTINYGTNRYSFTDQHSGIIAQGQRINVVAFETEISTYLRALRTSNK